VIVTLTFRPEIEAGLLAKAQARGMALSEYLQSIVEQDALPPVRKNVLSELTRRKKRSGACSNSARGMTSASANP